MTAESCGRPTPVIIRVVHMAPGPTPTFTMSAPARNQIAGALCRYHIAGGNGYAQRQFGDRGEYVEHLLLMTVRGVDDQQIHPGLHQGARLGADIAVDTDGPGDAQASVVVDGRGVQARPNRTGTGEDAGHRPVRACQYRDRHVRFGQAIEDRTRVGPRRHRHEVGGRDVVHPGESVDAGTCRLGDQSEWLAVFEYHRGPV